ncbi:terpenoid synthase [Phlebopus sp. FC_14]|nr:terpenoid synthase [Phlebopus sp. FC_14]
MAKWPWSRRINPHYEQIKAEADQWFRKFDALTSQSLRAFEKCDFARLAALAYPDASRGIVLRHDVACRHPNPHTEQLRIACELIVVYFIVDEYTDVEDSTVTAEVVEIIIDALKCPSKPRPTGEVVLGEIVRQFWSRAIKSASLTSQRHFIDDYVAYLRGVVVEATDRDKGTRRNIQEYLEVRRLTVGVQSAFVIFELDMDLPDEAYYHPTVVELINCITELVIIDNDMASYNREQATGDKNHNLISAIMHETGLDSSGAMSRAASYHAEIETKFIDGLSKVPSWGPLIDSQLKRYLHGMANWARANYCWSYESQRYFGNKGLDVQKSRMIPLLPRAERDVTLRGRGVVVVDIDICMSARVA